jgi:hypothetical protein
LRAGVRTKGQLDEVMATGRDRPRERRQLRAAPRGPGRRRVLDRPTCQTDGGIARVPQLDEVGVQRRTAAQPPDSRSPLTASRTGRVAGAPPAGAPATAAPHGCPRQSSLTIRSCAPGPTPDGFACR